MVLFKLRIWQKITLPVFLLLLATLIGGLLRVWKLGTLPLPPNGDELAFGFNGWSLLHFRTDEYGNLLPLYFPSIGDFKYPTLAYLNTIPAAIFGLSDFTPRFWSALMGTALILLIFVLSRLIFASSTVGVAAAFLIALSPWSISLSRFGYESNIAVFLTTAAITLLVIASKVQRPKIGPLNTTTIIFASFFLFLLSSFCYGAQRIFIPGFLLACLAISFIKNSELARIKKPLLILFVVLTGIIILSLIPWQSRGRASGVLSLTVTAEDQVEIDESIRDAGLAPVRIPATITRAFHNKASKVVTNVFGRYLNHFSPDYLFLKGDASLETTPGIGVLLFLEAIFLPIGIMFLVSQGASSLRLLILAWLLIGPIASTLTVGGPHILRGSIGLIPFSILSGLGIAKTIEFSQSPKYKKLLIGLVVFLVSVNSLFVANQIFVQKPAHIPWDSDQATRAMVEEVLKLKDKYKFIALPDDQYIFFLYYGKITPEQFQQNAKIRSLTKNDHWEPVERLGNIYFKMPYDCPKGGKLDTLYVCKGGNIPQNSRIIKVIRFQDRIPAYTLLEFFPLTQLPATLPSLPERLAYMVDREYLYPPDGIIPEDQPLPW